MRIRGHMSIRLRPSVIDRIRDLQAHIETTTGVKPKLAELLDRAVERGVDDLRARSYAVDTTPKTRA